MYVHQIFCKLLLEPKPARSGTMAEPCRIALVHEGAVIAIWSSKVQSITLLEAMLHVPTRFEAGRYKILHGEEELVDQVMVDTAIVTLTLVHATLRVSVVLRLLSGKKIREWHTCAAYTRLCDLRIPRARNTYAILKQGRALADHQRIWEDGEPEKVELTMVIIREAYFVFHLYLHVGGAEEYTAFLLPGFSVPVAASSEKVPLRIGLRLLYQQLLEAGGDCEKHVVLMLQEDIEYGRVLRRDLLPFAVATNKEMHLGHVRAIAMLEDDQRFVLRLKKEMFVLEDAPTAEQTRAIKDNLLELSPEAD